MAAGATRDSEYHRSTSNMAAGATQDSLFVLLLLKKIGNARQGRGRLTPYQSEDPSPILPTYRGKEEKGKIVEDKKGESN